MGFGDDIMATAEAREAKKNNPNTNIVIGDGKKIFNSVIFLNNPNIYQKDELNDNEKFFWIKNYINNRPYINYKKTNKTKIYWNEDFVTKPGDIFLTENEKVSGLEIVKQSTKLWEDKFGKKSKFVFIIEPNIKSQIYSSLVGSRTIGDTNLNRDWGFERWQKLVDCLCEEVTFIQTFKGNVRKLRGVIDVECNFRNAMSILKNSNAFIGHHSGLSHAAAALNKPAINIFGGWISPEITGYESHTNFYIADSDSPCGSKTQCLHCSKCMDQIKVHDVVDCCKTMILNS